MIEVTEIGKSYGPIQAVKDVTFSVGKGEIVGLLGPNGAGKTTLMKILTGYHYPDYGRVMIGGKDILENPEHVKSIIGYLPENAPVYSELTVFEYLDFIAGARGLGPERRDTAIAGALEECGLTEVVYRPIDQLSKGYRQRVGLAQVIIHDPDILILDEPTSGLDPNQIMEIRRLIKDLGREKTVILSTHVLREVEAVCTRILIMNDGEFIASGTSEEIGRQMRGGIVITLSVKGDKRAVETVAEVGCVEEVISTEEAEGRLRLQVAVRQGGDAGEELFDWAVTNGLKLTEMCRSEMSLEDIFIQLTGKEGAVHE
ncbi:MAG: ATP-binding cassette domain-containing protein [Spirochaetia bacterium]